MMPRSSTKYVVHLLLSLSLCAVYQEMSAQPARAADAGQSADELFQKGRTLYQAGKIREAREALAAAWALKKSYDIAANLATAEIELGMARDAAEHFAYCIRTFPSTGSKKQLGVVRKSFDDARAKVGALQLKVNVEGAEVLIDGKPIGRAPLKDEVYVEPGARMVEAKLTGYESVTQSVQVVKGGAVQPVTLTLVEAKAAPLPSPPPVGGATGSGKPDDKGTLKVDAGKGPTDNGDLGKGDGHGVQPPKGPDGKQPPVAPAGPSVPLIIGGAALGAVAIATGIGLEVAAQGKGRDAAAVLEKVHDSGTPCMSTPQAGICEDLHSLLGQHDGYYKAFVGLVVSGAVVGAATVGYALWPRPKPAAAKQERSTSVRVVPTVGPDASGVLVSGTF